MTDAERKIWSQLRLRQLAGARFRRQVPIGRYIADFACFECRLVIEIDGGQHQDSRYDAARDDWIRMQGFAILRFWNNDVLINLEGVLETILRHLGAAHPHPGLPPSRGKEST